MGTKYQGTEEEIRALDVYIKLNRAQEALEARLNQRASRTNLTISQFGALEALMHLGPMNQHEIARKLLKSGGNITVVIDNLERRGLVLRTRDTIDRRQVIVTLTDEGRDLIERIFPGHVESILEEMNVLSAEEQEQLGNLLRKLGRSQVERQVEAR